MRIRQPWFHEHPLHTQRAIQPYIEHHAADLLRALDDPRLVVVAFDPLSTSFTDPDFLRTPAARAFFGDFRSRLEADFARRDDLAAPFVLWTRTR